LETILDGFGASLMQDRPIAPQPHLKRGKKPGEGWGREGPLASVRLIASSITGLSVIGIMAERRVA
jgi:hypothetical protein